MIDALCVIDVVEGSAMESLSSMQCFLSSRPKQFSTPQQAIEYMVRSGQVRNLDSARVSIIGQIQPIDSQETSSVLPVVSHSCDTVQEEDEDSEGNEPKTTQTTSSASAISTSSDPKKYTWRIDLSKTERFWQGWFTGLYKHIFLFNCSIFI